MKRFRCDGSSFGGPGQGQGYLFGGRKEGRYDYRETLPFTPLPDTT